MVQKSIQTYIRKVVCLSCWDLPNHIASHHTLGTLESPQWARVQPLDLWCKELLNIEKNCCWKFNEIKTNFLKGKNGAKLLLFLESLPWVGFLEDDFVIFRPKVFGGRGGADVEFWAFWRVILFYYYYFFHDWVLWSRCYSHLEQLHYHVCTWASGETHTSLHNLICLYSL